MANTQRDKIEYDFEDLRRNEDPLPDNVLDQLGLEEADLTEDERQEDTRAKDGSEELEEEAEAELDDDGEYSPAKMTKAMRKRIVGVQRKANRAIADAKEEAGATISKLEQRIVDLEKAGKTDELEDEFSGKLDDIESKIEAAMEAGDSKLVSQLTREMSEITADKRDQKRELERKGQDDLEDEEQPPKIIPRAAEWIRDQEWWDDEELGHVRAYVRKADMALQKKGYKPTDDDFYERLESLVEEKYPGVVEHTMSEEEDEDLDLDEDEYEDEDEDEFAQVPSKKSRRKAKKKRARRRSPVSEGDRGGVAKTKKKRRASRERKLTAARVANMRTFGMDPENPEHVEAYLDNNP